MISRFEGRIAIVTGAARGVGARAAELLLEEGSRVVAVDRRGDELRERFASWPDVCCVTADVSETVACEGLVAAAEGRFGALDLVFANAGVTVRASLEETFDDVWHSTVEANLASVFRLFRAAAPALARSGGGSLVANASINALKGNLDLTAYSASKAGVLGLTRALALELAPRRIRVNAVCPGTVDTPMTHEHLASVDDGSALHASLVAKHPLGRLATADDVARAALFLLSDDAAFVTGVALPVDGGRHIA